MDLTLDSSINVTHLIDKEDGLKVVFSPKTEKQEKVKEPKYQGVQGEFLCP